MVMCIFISSLKVHVPMVFCVGDINTKYDYIRRRGGRFLTRMHKYIPVSHQLSFELLLIEYNKQTYFKMEQNKEPGSACVFSDFKKVYDI